VRNLWPFLFFNHERREAVMSVPAAYLGVVLIWATTPLAIQWSSEGGGFAFGVTGRMVLAAVLMFVALRALRIPFPWHREARRVYLVSASGIFGALFATYWAAQYIPSGLISVLFATAPIVTSVFAALWLDERGLTTLKVTGIATGIAGLALVFRSGLNLGPHAVLGILAMLFAVTVFSLSGVWVKRAGGDLHALAVNAGGLTLASLMFIVAWVLVDGHLPQRMPGRAIGSIVYLGVVGTAVGYSLYMYLLKKLPAATLALVTLLTPVFALWLGHVLNHETVAPVVWAGTALVLLGLMMHQWQEWRAVPAG
jgi:drug/metabolite transporter (DMT)-like permease